MHSLRETGTSRTASEFHTETGPYYYRARYYDANVGRFISEDKWDVPMNELVNLYAYVPGNAINFSDPLGQFTLKPGMNLPWPNLRLQALLECIEFNTGIPLIVISVIFPDDAIAVYRQYASRLGQRTAESQIPE